MVCLCEIVLTSAAFFASIVKVVTMVRVGNNEIWELYMPAINCGERRFYGVSRFILSLVTVLTLILQGFVPGGEFELTRAKIF